MTWCSTGQDWKNLREKEKPLSVYAPSSSLGKEKGATWLCGRRWPNGGPNPVLGVHALLVHHSTPHGWPPPSYTRVHANAPAEARGKTGCLPPDRNASKSLVCRAVVDCRRLLLSALRLNPPQCRQSVSTSSGRHLLRAPRREGGRQRGDPFTGPHLFARYVRL